MKPTDVPAVLRAALEAACGGDWSRVVPGKTGGFVVRNTGTPGTKAARVPRKRVAKPVAAPPPVLVEVGGQVFDLNVVDPPPVRVLRCGRCDTEGHGAEDCSVPLRPRKSQPTPAQRREKLKTVALEDLASAFATAPTVQRTEGGVTIVRQRDDREHLRDRTEWVEPTEVFDWTKVSDGVVGSAVAMAAKWAGGYEGGFSWLPDVLALEGMDLDIVEDAMRFPERVEVRPESKAKGYPVLGFHRGDVMTVLGMKDPTKPCVIAAYVGSRLENDMHRPKYHTGGGGGKAEKGLPKTPTQLLARLRGLGCKTEPDEAHERATVTYEGHDLGKVTIGALATRQQVETDYQRCVRRVLGVQRTA